MIYEYKFTKQEIDFILYMMGKIELKGIQEAEFLVNMKKVLMNPVNKEDLEKKEYEKLKEKFNKKK